VKWFKGDCELSEIPQFANKKIKKFRNALCMQSTIALKCHHNDQLYKGVLRLFVKWFKGDCELSEIPQFGFQMYQNKNYLSCVADGAVVKNGEESRTAWRI
jgi:hypothetical protein